VRVCVVGSGGREHALADVLSRTAEVVVTPGNPGIPGSVSTPPEEIEADGIAELGAGFVDQRHIGQPVGKIGKAAKAKIGCYLYFSTFFIRYFSMVNPNGFHAQSFSKFDVRIRIAHHD
jgi:hypothetical protein